MGTSLGFLGVVLMLMAVDITLRRIAKALEEANRKDKT
jgi:hypothetical protein